MFEKITDYHNLEIATQKAQKRKRYKPEVLKFNYNLERNLIEIQNELMWKTYEQGKYRQFYVYEPKKRLIMALPFKDRVVQWSIYRKLYPIFDKAFYRYSGACRRGKGTHFTAYQLQDKLRIMDRKPGKTYFLKADVSKYFYRIVHKRLFQLIKRKISCRDTLELIWQIIKSEDGEFGIQLGDHFFENKKVKGIGTPIGNLMSQLFANIYLDFLDKFVKHTLKVKYYVRYMDDFVLLGKDKKKLHTIRQEIEIFLEDYLQLQLNNKTTVGHVNEGIDFCGYVLYPSYSKLRKSTKKKMKKRFKYLNKKYFEGKVDIEDINASVNSYLGIIKHCDSYNLKMSVINKLDDHILEQLDLGDRLKLKSI